MWLQSRQVPTSFSMQRKNLEHLEHLSFVFVVFPPLDHVLSHSLLSSLCSTRTLCFCPSWLWGVRGPQAARRGSMKSVHVQMGSSTCLWPAWVPRATSTVISASKPSAPPPGSICYVSVHSAVQTSAFPAGATRQRWAEFACGSLKGAQTYHWKYSCETVISEWSLDTKVQGSESLWLSLSCVCRSVMGCWAAVWNGCMDVWCSAGDLWPPVRVVWVLPRCLRVLWGFPLCQSILQELYSFQRKVCLVSE